MKIRFISDIHAGLNMTYSPTEFVDIMKQKEKADVTIIAGDMDADIEEAKTFLSNYFEDEKVIFIGGNHIVYNSRKIPLSQLLDNYKKEFNGQWKFLENDYAWLNENVAVIGCIGWTDYYYHSKKEYKNMVDDKNRPIDQDGNLLPIDPRDTPEFQAKIRAIWDEEKTDHEELDKKMRDLYNSVSPAVNERVDTTFKNRVSKEVYNNYINWFEGRNRQGKKEYTTEEYITYHKNVAKRSMNDFNYGRMDEFILEFGEYRHLTPDDCEKLHWDSIRQIKRCYNQIMEKNPNATVILVTHHPFVTKCESARYKGDPLNAAFISDHDNWLKRFKSVKYYHCGHVHSRFFDKINDTQIICNPMGYLYYDEHTFDKPFNINYILEI